ncbi:MAG: hypothetical protein M3237_09555, partial [Actinomycetota bacterium]|nr:hypothetical protein [Actinomycetota bacterium]
MLKWIVGAVVLVVIGVGLWAFEPWRAFTSSEADEPVPEVAADSTPSSTAGAPESPSSSPPAV